MSQKKPSKPAKVKKAKAKKQQAKDQAQDDLSDIGGGASFEMKPFLAVILVTIAFSMMLWNGFQGERAALKLQEAAAVAAQETAVKPQQKKAAPPKGAPPCAFEVVLGQPITRSLVDAMGRPYRLYETKSRPQWGAKPERVNLGVKNGIISEFWCG